MTGDAWDTEFGRYILARAAYYRRGSLSKLPESPVNLPGSGQPLDDDSTTDADAAFLREIEAAREVCEDQVKGDAATAFLPDVPLPFGGNDRE